VSGRYYPNPPDTLFAWGAITIHRHYILAVPSVPTSSPRPLHELLAERVDAWRLAGYPSQEAPAIGEVLEWARGEGGGNARFLRAAQIRALEAYWYLRLVERTPDILALHRKLFPTSRDLRIALGLTADGLRDIAEDIGLDALLDRVKSDDQLVKDFKLEALRETLTLAYPSYILALAMGAGKTILIGAIIATEFAMAIENPDGPFVQNALVFAPGTTIIVSLRELLEVPWERVLPPRLHKVFAASVKFNFTRDGSPTIDVVDGSLFNVVVTNTEKIRIQKENIRKGDLGPLFGDRQLDEARRDVANRRLQAIASLPHLGVFSDEAHHTYGQGLDTELKKVRKTVDYLATRTNLICVVNTTGTPYFKRQPLKDVVVWYGLSQGIRDGILKDVGDNVRSYEFDGDTARYVRHVIEDFVKDYGGVRLPDGSPAKLAIFFPQTDDLAELKPVVEATVTAAGLPTSCILVNTSDPTLTKTQDVEAFDDLNHPASPHRVMLLVNKGTEGWNCPSLFACALARTLRSSNNFVLQAATRCLRQVPGNTHQARIYLSADNFSTLDNQLRETYGESIQDLNHGGHESATARIVLRKPQLPPVVLKRQVKTVTRSEESAKPIELTRPNLEQSGLIERSHTVGEPTAGLGVLRPAGPGVTILVEPAMMSTRMAANEIASRTRADYWTVLDQLNALYDGDVPANHLDSLSAMVEHAVGSYIVRTEWVDVALALVRLDPVTGLPHADGWRREIGQDGADVYVADIIYPKQREHLLSRVEDHAAALATGLGYHYTPYDFDSNPERSFFEQMLERLRMNPADVEEILFTGALTDPGKTEFFVEYRDTGGKWRRYTPDFVIRRRPAPGAAPGTGAVMIVEVKREHDRAHPEDGEHGRKAMAVRRLVDLDPERLRYEILFTDGATIAADAVDRVLTAPGERSA